MMDNMAYARGVTDNLKYSWNRIRLIDSLVPEAIHIIKFLLHVLFQNHGRYDKQSIELLLLQVRQKRAQMRLWHVE